VYPNWTKTKNGTDHDTKTIQGQKKHATLVSHTSQYIRMDDVDDDQINAQQQQMAEQKIVGSTTAFDGYKLWILKICGHGRTKQVGWFLKQ
jgi:hypothetical protein